MYKVGIYIVSDLKKNIITKFAVKMDGFRMYNTKQGHTISENKPHVRPHMQVLVNNINIYVNNAHVGIV